MKFFTYIVLMAPLALANPLPAPEIQLKVGISEKAAAPANLFKRERSCKIVASSASVVNCRSGPGTTYPILATLSVGGTYSFKCRKLGQCLNNGAGGVDCGWDYNDVPAPACYVWEDYTDNNCSPSLLPAC